MRCNRSITEILHDTAISLLDISPKENMCVQVLAVEGSGIERTINECGFSLGAMKCSKIDSSNGCTTLNILKEIELYTLNE